MTIEMENIKIVLSSACQYEDLVAEIYYRDMLIAALNQEDGADAINIELADGSSAHGNVTLSLALFEAAISMAKQRLKKI